jgi:ribosomal protein S18 acetylase RimI-like enzyme
VAEELEFDRLDEKAAHILAYLDGIAVKTQRIRQLSPENAKIELLAVSKTARGRGIGRQLMEKAIAIVMLDR